jgi:hypothetical protein
VGGKHGRLFPMEQDIFDNTRAQVAPKALAHISEDPPRIPENVRNLDGSIAGPSYDNILGQGLDAHLRACFWSSITGSNQTNPPEGFCICPGAV